MSCIVPVFIVSSITSEFLLYSVSFVFLLILIIIVTIPITKNIISCDKEKCKIAIEDSMYSSCMRLIYFMSTTVVNNHININSCIRNAVCSKLLSSY